MGISLEIRARGGQKLAPVRHEAGAVRGDRLAAVDEGGDFRRIEGPSASRSDLRKVSGRSR